MRLIVAVLFMLTIVAVIFQVAFIANAIDFNGHSQAPDTDIKKIETRMAETLRSISSASRSTNIDSITAEGSKASDFLIDAAKLNSSINSSINKSSLNNSSLNTSAINSSLLNTSAQNETGGQRIMEGSAGSDSSSSGASMLSDSTQAATQELGTSSRGTSNGFWGIQASKHVMGQSDVKSKMFLSGKFDVDKTVQFTDQGN